MPRDWRFRIEDILDAIAKIRTYTEEFDLAGFKIDPKTIDAVLRNLEVIGEAAGHVPEQVAERYPDIPWRRMRALRNVLAHEYFGIDPEIIWKTIREELPPLVPALNRIPK